MKKVLLTFLLLTVFIGIGIYFSRQQLYNITCANDQIMRPIFAENRVTHHNWVSNWKPGRSVTYGKHNEGQTPDGVEAQTVPG
jgi:hypothetical protein